MRKRLLTNPVRLTTIGWAVPISVGWIVGWITGLAIKWPYSHFNRDIYWSGWLGGAIGMSLGWAISGWTTGVALSQKHLSMKRIKMVMVGWVIALLIGFVPVVIGIIPVALIGLLGSLDASYYAPGLSVTVGWFTLCTLPVLTLIWPFLSGGIGGFLTILIVRLDNPAIEIADALVVARSWAIGLLVGCVVGLPIPGCIHTILALRPLNTSKDIGALNLLILSGIAIALGLGIAGAVTGSLGGRLMFQRLANVGQDPG